MSNLVTVHGVVCLCLVIAAVFALCKLKSQILVQAMVEDLLKEYPNCLVLRVRMPIVADLTYPRNFITKIIKYDKVGQL